MRSNAFTSTLYPICGKFLNSNNMCTLQLSSKVQNSWNFFLRQRAYNTVIFPSDEAKCKLACQIDSICRGDGWWVVGKMRSRLAIINEMSIILCMGSAWNRTAFISDASIDINLNQFEKQNTSTFHMSIEYGQSITSMRLPNNYFHPLFLLH